MTRSDKSVANTKAKKMITLTIYISLCFIFLLFYLLLIYETMKIARKMMVKQVIPEIMAIVISKIYCVDSLSYFFYIL